MGWCGCLEIFSGGGGCLGDFKVTISVDRDFKLYLDSSSF